MTIDAGTQSAADIQHDIDQDRKRIEKRIDAIQERMSPGQLIDEVLGYFKNSGGGDYVSNLGAAVKGNPIPVAMMGVSLAWLIAGTGGSSPTKNDYSGEKRSYPLATVTGDIWRIDTPESEAEGQYTHFVDDAGKRFKALKSSAGKRAGDFVDEAGNTYRGFADAAGNRISDIKEQTGALWDSATDWLSDTWEQVSDTAVGLADSTAEHAHSLRDKTQVAGASIRGQANLLNETILTHFRDQPLVGGALAFAVGAAIGAALPNTEIENAAVGEAAERVMDGVAETADEFLEKGKTAATNVYEQAVGIADEVYDVATERLKTDQG